ncbi:hypothetical protein [uncultured Cellulomonas sp.]|uniref:hypothetical protein n=1 Tax=uncultured Cellulomonas sp. TaxID=189682 RepID=UPI0028E9C2F6|nr:hypothetical protein [uncultured Cellulomonas sp.]
MTVISIEFAVVDYDAFHALWEEDRTNRATLGVRSYRILRPLDDDHVVTLHYEVDDAAQAEAVVAALRTMLEAGPIGKIVFRPDFRIYDEVAAGTYAR